jgi:aryl carrier-like protein
MTATEQALAEIWLEVLGADTVTPDDNFFALGGSSLKAMQVVSRARRLGWQRFGLADMFKATSLREMAQALDGADA